MTKAARQPLITVVDQDRNFNRRSHWIFNRAGANLGEDINARDINAKLSHIDLMVMAIKDCRTRYR